MHCIQQSLFMGVCCVTKFHVCMFSSDEDEEGERQRVSERSVPLSPLERFFSDDSVKQHKKKKPSKITEGKEEKPKLKKKKKKEVSGSQFQAWSQLVNLYLISVIY